jgi:hypothetical protein
MAKKTVKLRAWTATDIHKMKGLAKKKVGVAKIAKALKRTVGATTVKAHLLGVSLDTRGWFGTAAVRRFFDLCFSECLWAVWWCSDSFVIRGIMTTQRPRANRLTSGSKQQASAAKFPARLFPVQHEIQNLGNDLDAFNERIAELENEGHRGHAMEVLKANAIDLARKIDELRCLLAEPTK